MGSKATHNIAIVKVLEINITFGSDIPDLLCLYKKENRLSFFQYGFSNALNSDDLFQNVRRDFDMYWNIDKQKKKKICKQGMAILAPLI